MKCPHCGIETTLREYNPTEYKRRKIANAKDSLAKAKANGTKLGRRPKVDRELVKFYRTKGFSIRDIAIELKVSSSAIWRACK